MNTYKISIKDGSIVFFLNVVADSIEQALAGGNALSRKKGSGNGTVTSIVKIYD